MTWIELLSNMGGDDEVLVPVTLLPQLPQAGWHLFSAVKAYWWKGKANFGDLLTGPLLARFCGLKCEWAVPEEAELVMVGSVLEHLPPEFGGVIAGAGKMHGDERQNFFKANIVGVRGELTANRLGLGNGVVIGDPALLANELVPLLDKKHDLGLVPHWTDHDLERNPAFIKFAPKIIRVTNDPLEVIAQIGACKRIVSSSLHGIILADAFGIPRRIELAPRMRSHAEQEGGIFKWLDYHTSIKTKFEIGLMVRVDRNRIVDKQSELFDMFETLSKLFR